MRHGVAIVLVINFDVSVCWFALPIRHQLEWTGLSSMFVLHQILEDVHVKVASGGILLGLASQELCEGRHVEL